MPQLCYSPPDAKTPDDQVRRRLPSTRFGTHGIDLIYAGVPMMQQFTHLFQSAQAYGASVNCA